MYIITCRPRFARLYWYGDGWGSLDTLAVRFDSPEAAQYVLDTRYATDESEAEVISAPR